MNSAGNQLLTGAGFAEDQHRTVALRHHLHLLEHAVHGLAAANDFAKLALNVVELFGQGEVLIDQPLFQPLNLAVGEGVVDGDRDALGDLPQQLEVGGGEDFFIALRQLQHPKQSITGHQRQQAQGLDFVIPHLEKHFFVRRQRVVLVEIEQQHLFAFEYPLGQGTGFVHFALVMYRMAGVEVVGGVDIELTFAVAAQYHADGVDAEVAVDLFGHFADQLIDIQPREHRVGDRHQDAEVIAFPAQQVVIDVVADPALDLFGDHGNDLRKGVQPLVLFFGPRPVVVANKFAAAEDTPFRRQRQQAVIAKVGVESAYGELRPGFGKGGAIAMQRIRAREQASNRAVGEDGFILVAHRLSRVVAGVPDRAMVAGMPQNNRRPVGERGLLHQAGQRLAQRGQVRLL